MRITLLKMRNHLTFESGSIAVQMILFLPFLLGVMALAFNYGNLAIVKTQLQTATDACALSAAKQLNGSTSQFELARTAGTLAASKNNANNLAVTPTVMFDTSLTGSFTTTGNTTTPNPANYKYVECTASATVNKLMAMMNNTDSDVLTVKSYGGLEPSSSACVLPLSICSNAPAITNPTTTKLIQGNVGSTFRWACFGNGCNTNATNISTLLSSQNTCSINLVNQPVNTTNGVTNSLRGDFNTRFGLRSNGNTGSIFLPDYTGINLRPCESGCGGSTTAASNYTSSQLSTYTSNRLTLTKFSGALPSGGGYASVQPTVANASLRRIALAPVINCSIATNTQQTITSRANWACILLLNPMMNNGDTLYFEYLGNASSQACSQFKLAGGTGGPLTATLVK